MVDFPNETMDISDEEDEINMMGTKKDAPLILGRHERIRRHGVDCAGPFGDGILFRGGEWTVGGEYVQKLTVKNVSTRMRKLKYRLPGTRYFSLLFPELIDLSPGMHVDIDVVFRPVKMEVYDDTIYFKIVEAEDSGGFHVPVRALLSTLQVSVPPGLDFGLCPTAEKSRYMFDITNTGEVPAPFEWTCPAPFTLKPDAGVVPVGESVTIEASLTPTDASVFVSLATCEVGSGVNAIKPRPVLQMRLSAIGKYTFIVPSEERVDFGTLLVGQTEDTSKDLVLHNRSMVPATVHCERVESDREPVFSIAPLDFVIPPQSEIHLNVKYSPVTAGMYTMEHFDFITPGGNKATVCCSAQAASPVVRLFKKEDPYAMGFGVSNSINFGNVMVGERASRALFLANDADISSSFQFIVEENGCFKFSTVQGKIPGALEVNLRVDFTPTAPTNFYQRIFCLVENAAPIFVDVLGTGFVPPKGEIKEQRPAPMRHAHIQAYRNRCVAGYGRHSPKELESLLERKGINDLFAKMGMEGTGLLAGSAVKRPVTRSGEATRNDIAVASEFFQDPTCPELNPVHLSMDTADFGYVSVGGAGDRRTVTLTNTSHSKVTVQWIVPSDGAADFSVSPVSVDIGAGRSFDFKFVFRPSQTNFYYCQEVEAYVFFKNQRTFRLVNDAVLQPPWCCKLKGIGHTLATEQFAAQVSISARNGTFEFPGCHVGDACYQTIRLTNSSNLPAQFQFPTDSGSAGAVFDVKPRAGIIPANDFYLVLLKFRPTAARKYEYGLKCVINHEPDMAQTVTLIGEGAIPTVKVLQVEELRRGLSPFAPTPPLYMKPTCTGLVSSRAITLHNPVRIPIVFKVEVPARLANVFSVSPTMGLLRGNQDCALTVSFAPRAYVDYKLKLNIKVRALAGDPPDLRDARMFGEAVPAEFVHETSVNIIAPGSGAVLSFDPPLMDFGTLLVNTTEDIQFGLVNASDCDVQYEIHHLVRPEKREVIRARSASMMANSSIAVAGGPSTPEPNSIEPMPSSGRDRLLLTDKPAGVIGARSRTAVKLTFQPLRAAVFEVALIVRVTALDREGNRITLTAEESALLRVGDKARLAETFAVTKAVTDGQGENLDDDEHSVSSEDIEAMGLRAEVRGKASFPTVVFQDVRQLGGGLGGSTRQLWASLGLEHLNHELAQPLTPAEVKLNLESSPDLTKLKKYDIKFVPAPLGTAKAVVSVQLCNPGFLQTSFEIHYPNEREIELPQWADEGEPTMDQLKENRIIDELKCFDVYPRAGVLSSGESVTINFTYTYENRDYDGCHELKVLLKVAQGKQYWLRLKGVTLAPSDCCLYRCVPPEDSAHRIMPVAVGTSVDQAPVQTTELLNVGEADLQYEVDVSSLKAGRDDNFGFQSMVLENPMGTISGRSTALLRWRFLPLEAKEYFYSCKIKYSGGAVGQAVTREDTIRVYCFGYDPRTENPHTMTMPGIKTGLVPPPYQLLRMPAQVAALSHEKVALGRIPQRAVVQETVVLRNTCDQAVEFQWEASHPLLASGVVRIEPLNGRIAPQSFESVKVVVEGGCAPCIVEQQIAVLVKLAAVTQPKRNNRSRLESRLEASKSRNAASEASHRSIVSRPTKSRDANLASTVLPGGRQPHLPVPAMSYTPGQPPAAGAGDAGATTSVGFGNSQTAGATTAYDDSASMRSGTSAGGGRSRGGGGAAPNLPPSFLHLSLYFEIVEEDAFISLFSESVNAAAVQRPRQYIPAHAAVVEGGQVLGVVPHVEKAHAEAELSGSAESPGAHVLGGVFSGLFADLLSSSEVLDSLHALPATPQVPVYAEMRRKDSIVLRLERAMGESGLDASVPLPPGELKAALVKLGLKSRTAGVKDAMRTLESGKGGGAAATVGLREWMKGCPAEMTLAIEEALDERDQVAAVAVQEGRQRERDEADKDETDVAATKLQGRLRMRQAKKDVEAQRFKLSDEGKRQHEMANKLQNLQRGKLARVRAKELQAKKAAVRRQMVMADPDFQGTASEIMESTISNLLAEVLNAEFDVRDSPHMVVQGRVD